jgi:hypothetical protein
MRVRPLRGFRHHRERERESNLAPGVDDLRNVEFLLGNLEALAENLGFGVCVERAVVLWC